MTTETLSRMHVVGNRDVITWRPEGWPAGAITGYREADTFHVEHVIIFNGASASGLMDMLRDGLEEARTMGVRRIAWFVPHCFGGAPGLIEIGRRLGFREDRRDEVMAYFVREL